MTPRDLALHILTAHRSVELEPQARGAAVASDAETETAGGEESEIDADLEMEEAQSVTIDSRPRDRDPAGVPAPVVVVCVRERGTRNPGEVCTRAWRSHPKLATSVRVVARAGAGVRARGVELDFDE